MLWLLSFVTNCLTLLRALFFGMLHASAVSVVVMVMFFVHLSGSSAVFCTTNLYPPPGETSVVGGREGARLRCCVAGEMS